MHRLVVVGASLAGLRAAQAARATGFAGELTVIGDEPHLPYTRPPLSKELLTGGHTADQCEFPHRALEVSWRLGVPATGLDRPTKTVKLADGETVPYDRLILATGSRAREWPGSDTMDLEGVHTLRTIDDALALRSALGSARRLVIVGAGFIGCEVAASARGLGVEVTLLDIAPQPMLPLGPELGRRCAQVHSEHGVDVRCATGLSAVLGSRRVEAVELTDGTRVEADVVLIALGALPNTEWLADSGLSLDPGVVCDATLTAVGDADVLAAGDIASWPHPLAGGARARVEHWTTAAEHGQRAGRNVLLEPPERTPHELPPYFWSDQYELKIQAVGFTPLADQLEILESTPAGDRLVAAGGRNGRLVAVVAFNAAKRLAWYRRQIASAPALEQIRELVAVDDGALGAPIGAAG
jgi:NADPH-dependent 2,4-dienoyl-CoA reductase/sulfur reductase-like enzyme